MEKRREIQGRGCGLPASEKAQKIRKERNPQSPPIGTGVI